MDDDPATLEELRSHLHLSYPVHSWSRPEIASDGTAVFSCTGCEAVRGPYASQAEGDVALEVETESTLAEFRAFLESWAERHRDLAPKGTKFFMLVSCGPDPGPDPHFVWRDATFPRAGTWTEGDAPQRGLAEVVLSRQGLAGALAVSRVELAQRFDISWERSYVDDNHCDIAYLETEHDAFTLVHWDESAYVEVHSVVAAAGPGRVHGTDELERFLELAGLTWDDVHFPRRPRPGP